jgi:hypothetical protein
MFRTLPTQTRRKLLGPHAELWSVATWATAFANSADDKQISEKP